MEDKILTKREAIEFLGLEEKTFENYSTTAGEFSPLPRPSNRGRINFSKRDLEEWKSDYDSRKISLSREDYNQCLDFALAMHFRGYVQSDWGTARQREFGQKLTNWMKGQLAEVAVKKFLKKRFGVDVELDFSIYAEIVPQDIIAVNERGKPRNPRIGIGIKASKPKSAYLVLGDNEISIKSRRSDYYIFVRVDIPDDHLLRIASDEVIKSVKGSQHFHLYEKDIPKFSDITAEVVGYCAIEELEKVSGIPGLEFDGFRHVKQAGKLHRSESDWESLLAKL